ncbi:PD-(D/E)XK nuclease family protein [Mangrovibacterium diazotrophicum]|uniref:PD-(D/E)XK nuclease superfamily protein n=1 Tax=Mangrovibacterium diazotrophicum TaxID=1261403 RepID=A0A419VWG1_9BACT|nr:PD-(D/E)XK nuclease family protein [Mangrovibacterium diazotrophicum]RKD86490.1 PD-(D/E)XK nuclease superfamily protein [Mangrovibacterium diazotrophicum]
MEPFLKQVARHLYQSQHEKIDRVTVVFPSRRSGVFFNAYLNELIEKPILGPQAITINELVSKLSGVQISDHISQILTLHQIYKAETGHDESLDDFFFWGEILLNDFNDIDKYLLDANDLFRNISDLKDIERRFEYLSAEQKEAIEKFWGTIGKAGASVNREKFMQIWNKLASVYNRFRDELKKEGLAYTGMLYRDLVENWREETEKLLEAERYLFVGFNALNAAEEKLLSYFKKSGKGQFFWDYDPAFLDDVQHEAGVFIRRNLVKFPMPEGFELTGGDSALRKMTIVSVPGQVAQTQVLNHPKFAGASGAKPRFDETAMVLADEGLLVPLVSAAGAQYNRINITMGYPIQNTPVYSFINLLIELQKNYRYYGNEDSFYYKPVLALLNHQLLANPVTKEIVRSIHRENKIYVRVSDLAQDDLLKVIFSKLSSWEQAADYLMTVIEQLARRLAITAENEADPALEAEYLYQVYLAIQRLQATLREHHPAQISLALFFRILLQHLQRISIPFEGEPLSGLQVMGVLETRNLDFKRLFMFSVNEGRLPNSSATHSFIPYNLRKAFGLPAYEEHDAMYAYYFYRLINRAEEVVMVYDSSGDGMNSGEMSRYLFQLLYDSPVKPEVFQLNFDFKSTEAEPIAIASTQKHRDVLLNRYSERKLSPSALNAYLDCKLKFYFKYIAGIKETDELLEEVDPRLFGNLFHFASELIYSNFVGKQVQKEDLDAMLKNDVLIRKAIHDAFVREYYKDKALKEVKITGKNILIAENLHTYLTRMLENDKEFAPFKIVELEGNCEAEFKIETEAGEKRIKLGGIVDRIDQTKDGLRIIDYKTGRSLVLAFNNFEDFYRRDADNRPKEIFQTLVYSEIYRRMNGTTAIQPSIYKIDTFFTGDFDPTVKMRGQSLTYDLISEPFVESLQELLQEIFSPDNCFDQTTKKRKCESCPYNVICRRV